MQAQNDGESGQIQVAAQCGEAQEIELQVNSGGGGILSPDSVAQQQCFETPVTLGYQDIADKEVGVSLQNLPSLCVPADA